MSNSDSPYVAVIGADDYNLSLIENIPDYDGTELVPVLSKTDVQPPHGRIDFNALYDRAWETIDERGKPLAILGYLDFPVTSLVALLSRDFGLPCASPEAVAICEHKYWMREKQAEVFPDTTPAIRAVNPFKPDDAVAEALAYPFWLKPVKGHSSVLGFMIEDENDFRRAMHDCRQKIHLIGEPFNKFLDEIDDVSCSRDVDGNFAIAEELISADRQFTLEGYVWDGETVIYGAIDSVRGGKHQSTFSRYQYPGEIDAETIEEARQITERFLAHIGYDNAPFNVEFFWDPETGTLNMLEINPRISKSHAPLFRMVDGVTHHKVALDISSGQEPDMPYRDGREKIAAKFMFRSFEPDGIVKRVPATDEIEELKRILPDIDTNVLVEMDQQLSSLFYQESYSFELADIFLGGDTTEMLEDAYARCLDSLPIYIKPLPEAA